MAAAPITGLTVANSVLVPTQKFFRDILRLGSTYSAPAISDEMNQSHHVVWRGELV